jgi:CRISPR-associated protein Cas5d
MSQGSSYQHMAMILTNVCYRIYGEILLWGKEPEGVNSRHALQEIFMRRLEKEQRWHVPCLGWKEFVPTYIGPLRADTKVEENINEVIPSMLVSPFDAPVDGQKHAKFVQNVKIENGVLTYDQ